MNAEQQRVNESEDPRAPWRQWGPYVSARQWGTVREDYSADADAWAHFPFDHSHQRAYRWGEDGLAGLCDIDGFLNLGLALWNGRDDRLKERLFGLTNPQGNHGEDAKEYWWALDGTPTHSHAQWLYRYPQAAFPYQELIDGNAARGYDDDEFELSDTGVLQDNRFFDVVVTHAKASPTDIVMEVTATNHGPEAAPLHLVPQLWFRNTWSWGLDDHRPEIVLADGAGEYAEGQVVLEARHHELGRVRLSADGSPRVLFCDNETNFATLYGEEAAPAGHTAYPKDAINRSIVHGEDAGNPEPTGTKAALWWQFDQVGPGESVTVRLRLAASLSHELQQTHEPQLPVLESADEVLATRRREADEFFAEVIPEETSEEDRHIARRAFAGLQWGKQLYLYDVPRWLAGDPAQPPPPPERLDRHTGRNVHWQHVNLAEVISMPDEWEYPWFATWDLAFHTVPLAHVDPAFAKFQLLLMCREWAMHPNGQLPAYEWNFSDVNPPVHPWAAWQVYSIDGNQDRDFLQRIVLKMLLNFPWWVNRKDADGSNIFEGGFLGMDNVGLFDRSDELPGGGRLEQADATAWMGMFCLRMLRMSVELAREDPAWDEVATKFLVHFLAISETMEDTGSDHVSLWDAETSFFQDVLVESDGTAHRMPVRSMVGLLPLTGVAILPNWVAQELPDLTDFLRGWTERRPELQDALLHTNFHGYSIRTLSMISQEQLTSLVGYLLDEEEFLAPHGIRSLSAAHRDGITVRVGGDDLGLRYEPAESRSGMFGGNSNWRGPIWFPVNTMLTDALRIYGRGAGIDLQVEFPSGSGHRRSLTQIATELEQRLVSLFRPGPDGRRPSTPIHHPSGPLWDGHPTFSEYFNGDNGTGLGASHQTGWTAMVAHYICAPDGITNR
ncbi:MGH1-like glycoside hydrolase domain-containing protein [Ornithinimicrobium faecis]|uniref:Glucosidase n=1 Tax=Ornithinimicrobium faecis TaxID=2934158 RepID=A0ABY4YPH9_9MICO|nr:MULTISPECIES: glucosidase [unclassified Ornithinimicrobium]USQ78682.1 glucosidase [Ornithinimicrobium sp. HY1793]